MSTDWDWAEKRYEEFDKASADFYACPRWRIFRRRRLRDLKAAAAVFADVAFTRTRRNEA